MKIYLILCISNRNALKGKIKFSTENFATSKTLNNFIKVELIIFNMYFYFPEFSYSVFQWEVNITIYITSRK